MKIAHIIRTLEVGGAERVTVELANQFAAQHEDVTIFCAWPVEPASPVQAQLSPRVRVEHVQRAPSPGPGMYLKALWWTWRNRRRLAEYDVIHCHLTYGAFIGTLVYLLVRGSRFAPRVVETYHSVGAPISALTRRLHSLMATARDVFVLMATDSYWSRFVTDHPNLCVKLILNGARTPDVQSVDADERRRYRAQLGIPDDARFVVGSIGMLRRDRQPWAFLPVISELVREFGSEVHWVFAGDGPEREALEQLVASAGLTPNVHFTGLVRDVRYPLAVLDLHFTITVRDVGGVAAIEGALGGVPTIGLQAAKDYPSTTDWIWSSIEWQPLAAMAIRLLRDPAERRAMAERQQQYARAHHSVERMTQLYREVYSGAAVLLGKVAS